MNDSHGEKIYHLQHDDNEIQQFKQVMEIEQVVELSDDDLIF